jgi:hypothetical protein
MPTPPGPGSAGLDSFDYSNNFVDFPRITFWKSADNMDNGNQGREFQRPIMRR